MSHILVTHAGPIAAAAAATLIATIAIILLTLRHLEKRMQEIEHELATLHANNEVANAPSSTEVARRYAAMTSPQREAA